MRDWVVEKTDQARIRHKTNWRPKREKHVIQYPETAGSEGASPTRLRDRRRGGSVINGHRSRYATQSKRGEKEDQGDPNLVVSPRPRAGVLRARLGVSRA